MEFDRDYFRDLIILNDNKKHDPQTKSQKRIKAAKDFFTQKLEKLPDDELKKLVETLEKSHILSIIFDNKKDAVRMFELQNNRGKELSNMEKLKSYLSYQSYIFLPDKIANQKLNELSQSFNEIYRMISDLDTEEDAVLRYFNMSRSSQEFHYRENDENRNYKKELKDKSAEEKIVWIENYVKELKNAFVNFKDFEKRAKNKSGMAAHLMSLNRWEIYPFVLKAYALFTSSNKEQELENIFAHLEIIAFRDKMVNTRADLSTRLGRILLNFSSAAKLKDELSAVCEINYWSDFALQESAKDIYQNKDLLKYIFLHYEAFLRQEYLENSGYELSAEYIKECEIEHIAPQSQNADGGYCEYDEEFKNYFLNNIGNLVLINKKHNIILSNDPFETKLASFDQSTLFQHRELSKYATCKKWDKESIKKRAEKLMHFVLKKWSFA